MKTLNTRIAEYFEIIILMISMSIPIIMFTDVASRLV